MNVLYRVDGALKITFDIINSTFRMLFKLLSSICYDAKQTRFMCFMFLALRLPVDNFS